MSFLLDTNVLSELRKGTRTDAHVAAFAEAVEWDDIYTSWIVLAEMRRGAALVRRYDGAQAAVFDAWNAEILGRLTDRVLPVDQAVVDSWVILMVPNPRSPLDALIAATARAHDLTLVTRNVRDFEGAGLNLLNPWTFEG